jgi:hypothetical protein
MYSPFRFWLQVAGATVAGGILIFTITVPHWIEIFFNKSPDDGDGSVEITIALFFSLVIFVLLAGLGWRQFRLRGVATTDQSKQH